MEQVEVSPRVQIVTKEAELFGLAAAWDDLYARADKPYLTQSFEWVWCVWKKLMQGTRLRCVLVWRGDRLVLVWPAAITRFHRFWTAEVPIATGGDYVDLLAEPSPEAGRYGELAWRHRSRRVDLAEIRRVRLSSLLHTVIMKNGGRAVKNYPAHYLDWDQFSDWNTYYRSLSRRPEIARRQRRLVERGGISFRYEEDVDPVRSLTQWMFRHKEAWLAEKGFQPAWGEGQRYEEFLRAVPAELKRFGCLSAFALLHEDKTIAVKVCLVGTSRLIVVHSAYDHDYRQFSAQHILSIHTLEWACARKLTVDFCYGTQDFKKEFAPSNDPVEDFVLPNTLLGRVGEYVVSNKDSKAAGYLRSRLGRLNL